MQGSCLLVQPGGQSSGKTPYKRLTPVSPAVLWPLWSRCRLWLPLLLTTSLVKGTFSCFFVWGKQQLLWSLRDGSLWPRQPHGESLQDSPSLCVLGKDWPALPPAHGRVSLFPFNNGGVKHLPGTLERKRTSWQAVKAQLRASDD